MQGLADGVGDAAEKRCFAAAGIADDDQTLIVQGLLEGTGAMRGWLPADGAARESAGRGRVARLVARLSGVRQGGAQGGEWCVELVDLQAMDPLVADLKAADIDVARFFEQPS